MSNGLNNNSVDVTVNLPHLFLVQIIWIDGQQQSQIILDGQMLIYGDRFELGEGLLLPFKHFLNDVHINVSVRVPRVEPSSSRFVVVNNRKQQQCRIKQSTVKPVSQL